MTTIRNIQQINDSPASLLKLSKSGKNNPTGSLLLEEQIESGERPNELESMRTEIKALVAKVESLTNSFQSIFIKANNQSINLPLKDILYVEALGDYVNFFTETNRYVVHKTMKGIEEKLPAGQFKRVHRSFIVRIDKIQAIEESLLTIGKKLIPIGDVYRSELISTLNFL